MATVFPNVSLAICPLKPFGSLHAKLWRQYCVPPPDDDDGEFAKPPWCHLVHRLKVSRCSFAAQYRWSFPDVQ